MFLNYSEIIVSNKYSYKKNKIVMPFHKTLGLIIFTLYKGNLNDVGCK
jgi:hypothetical protein